MDPNLHPTAHTRGEKANVTCFYDIATPVLHPINRIEKIGHEQG